MVSPAAASISVSESKNGRCKRAARRRPILVLPAPISPTRTIVRLGTKSAVAITGPLVSWGCAFATLLRISRRSSAQRLGRVLAYRAASSSIGAVVTGIGRQSRYGKGENLPHSDLGSGDRRRLCGFGLLELPGAH